MKRMLICIALATALIRGASGCSYDLLITQEQLPAAASEFLDKHFSGIEISYIERDAFSYEVNFVNGWEVEFNRRGEWSHVDCKRDSVPVSTLRLLPESILNYVEAHFSRSFISEIEINLTGYEIGIENGPDLKFSRSGEFRRID